jgi:hypothetical protein
MQIGFFFWPFMAELVGRMAFRDGGGPNPEPKNMS